MRPLISYCSEQMILGTPIFTPHALACHVIIHSSYVLSFCYFTIITKIDDVVFWGLFPNIPVRISLELPVETGCFNFCHIFQFFTGCRLKISAVTFPKPPCVTWWIHQYSLYLSDGTFLNTKTNGSPVYLQEDALPTKTHFSRIHRYWK